MRFKNLNMKEIYNEMKKYVLLSVFFFAFGITNNYAQRTGGVKIYDDTEIDDKPDVSAMLDIVSLDKGLLIPHLNIDKIENDQILPLTDGLLVYIKDVPKGFYYYNGDSGEWVKIMETSAEQQTMIAPEGGIIMYHGEYNNFDEHGRGMQGTEMDGWHLCNGLDDTPDLRGLFVSGANQEMDDIGTKDGSDDYLLMEEQLPAHYHEYIGGETEVNASHNHHFYDPGHTHGMVTKHKGTKKTGELDRRDTHDSHVHTSSNYVNMSVPYADAFLEFDIGQTTPIVSDYPTSEANPEDRKIDNRPHYYVLAYIIRFESNFEE